MKRLLLIALCSVACVTTAQEGEQMRADIAALRTDLKKEVDATSADRQKDQQRAKALQDALDQLSRAARKSGADLAVSQTYYAQAVQGSRTSAVFTFSTTGL